MSLRSSLLITGIVSVILLVTFGIMTKTELSRRVEDRAEEAAYTDSPKIKLGGPFHLLDQDGNTRTEADFRGKYMIIYFGYSFCPDICPTALYLITQAMEKVGEKSRDIQPIFITIDPKRDTIARLKSYIKDYHPKLLALTGTEEQLSSVKKTYKVYTSTFLPSSCPEDYLIDHSSIIYLMDKKGRFLTHFNHSTTVEELTKYLIKL